jgi:hypothetical protein
MRWLLLRPKKGEFIVSDRGYSAVPLEGEGVETAIPLPLMPAFSCCQAQMASTSSTSMLPRSR